MKHLTQRIGGGSYWQGYTAPSTAFVATDLAHVSLGRLTETQPLEEFQVLPDIFDLLVDMDAVLTSEAPQVSLGSHILPVFQKNLLDYRLSQLNLVARGLIRVDGIIKCSEAAIDADITPVKFDVLGHDVNFDQATDKMPLGGFFQTGCDLDLIKQYEINFYEADGQISYYLHPGQLFVDYLRDQKIFLNSWGELSRDELGQYCSVDIKRHGNKSAWITFHKQN